MKKGKMIVGLVLTLTLTSLIGCEKQKIEKNRYEIITNSNDTITVPIECEKKYEEYNTLLDHSVNITVEDWTYSIVQDELLARRTDIYQKCEDQYVKYDCNYYVGSFCKYKAVE